MNERQQAMAGVAEEEWPQPLPVVLAPIPDEVLPHVSETQRMTSYGARKRQLAFLAKQMRRQDDEALDAIRDALGKAGDATRRETAAMHRVEALRDSPIASQRAR